MRAQLFSALLLFSESAAFTVPVARRAPPLSVSLTSSPDPIDVRRHQHQTPSTVRLHNSPESNESDDDGECRRNPRPLSKVSSVLKGCLTKRLSSKKPPALLLRLAVVVSASLGAANIALPVRPSHASAPVMALPKAEGRDPSTEALMQHERKMRAEAQEELNEMSRQAREIEQSQGEKARVKFEKEFKERQQRRATEKAEGLVQLQRNLLDQGIDPFVDLEGQRQVTFYEKGVDLGDVPGTPFHLDKEFERSNYKRSMAFQKAYHRQVIACMVQDLKNRNLDPLEYFTAHQTRTESILNLPLPQAKALAEQYAANLELYGQISPPKPGETSALERMKQEANSPATLKAAKAAAREEAQRRKEEAKAQAAVLKQLQKEEREQQKLQAKRQAERAKEQSQAAAQQAAAQALRDAAATMSDGIRTAESDSDAAVDSLAASPPPTSSAVMTPARSKQPLPILPVSAFLVAAGGGGYAFKMYREQAARNEEERRRQFQLLMGGADRSKSGGTSGPNGASRAPAPSASSSSLLDDVTVDTSAMEDDATNEPTLAPKVESATPEPAPAPAPKKKRRGLGVFSRRKNEREVDLNVLVSDGATAPEFALLLAKILTFGAPGRFPTVVALPGGMPLDDFDLEAAKQLLVDSRTGAGLELDESAEVFAGVVNCMLIDIVDLASSSLKEDAKTTIAAIDIVVDFMQHAASLYDSVAGNVVISPVTYGGNLARSKLEQMYSTYAGSVMTNMENTRDDFDDRVRLLQDVFQISDKKAEGLMLKVMQKNMMEMLKSGEGMEGMQEMLAGMGGLDGMPNGMPGMDGGEPSPEQVKEMLLALKGMKDSGSFSKEDLDKIKKEFKASFGDSVDDLTKGAPLDATEQELLDLMKSILDE